MPEQGVVQLFPMTAARSPEVARDQLRIIEAILFASATPVSEEELQQRLPVGADCATLLKELGDLYTDRGVNLTRVAGKWCFRTAPDLQHFMTREVVEQRRLSRAALETLAIVAYHQPVTRAEIEDIRGVMLGKGTLDTLLEVGWIRIRGRRKVPGRPVTYGTSDAFLVHFGLDAVSDLPGIDELIGAGLLEKNSLAEPRELEELPLADDTEGDLDPAGDSPEMADDARD